MLAKAQSEIDENEKLLDNQNENLANSKKISESGSVDDLISSESLDFSSDSKVRRYQKPTYFSF